VCARFVVQMVCSVGAIFILVRAERPYIQSSATRAADTFVAQCSVVGVTSGREREEILSLLCVGGPKDCRTKVLS
jgi:hypothetical protein